MMPQALLAGADVSISPVFESLGVEFSGINYTVLLQDEESHLHLQFALMLIGNSKARDTCTARRIPAAGQLLLALTLV